MCKFDIDIDSDIGGRRSYITIILIIAYKFTWERIRSEKQN